MSFIHVPTEEWVINSKKVVKVVLKGEEASTLPPDVFIKALHDNGVLKDNNSSNVRITIPHNNRKRFVYGDVNYSHRQTFSITFNQDNISFLLLDPDDARVQVTLLHMPIETSEGAIKHIFNEINNDFCVSDIKVAPGKQMRHDRWQLMIECSDIDDIPHLFILPNMGPEREHLKIKVFVEGRKAISDLPLPLSSRDSEQQNDTLEPANNSLTRSASHDTLLKQPAAATPTNQPPPPILTPSCRPRPTPSPNEEQPDLKRVRPENKDTHGDSNSIETTEYPEYKEDDESDEAREREKARREKDEAYRIRSEQRRAHIEEMRQARLRREEERQRYYDDNYYRRGYRGY